MAQLLLFLAIVFLGRVLVAEWRDQSRRNLFTILVGAALVLLGVTFGYSVWAASNIETAEAAAETAEAAAEVAAGLSQQLLSYTGRRSSEIELVNLNELISDDVNLYSLLFLRAGSIRLDLMPHLPLVQVRPIHIQQILMNLVINAAEAMADDMGVVTIRTGLGELLRNCEHGSKKKPTVCIQVYDTGCGMSAETVKHIFEPFFTTKSKGHGLGLSMIKEIVDSYHGHNYLFCYLSANTLLLRISSLVFNIVFTYGLFNQFIHNTDCHAKIMIGHE